MSSPQANTEWIPLQVKVFSRWVSTHLVEGKADVQVNDITKDLSNGVALVELAKILIGKDTPRHWVHDPKRNVDQVQNCDLSIEMFEKDGVHLVGISGKDIHDNKEKLILGYIWTLILHYSIGKSINEDDSVKVNSSASASSTAKSNKDALMKWAIDRTSNYPNIHNFAPYDLSMCALLDSYVPDKINYYQLDPKDSAHNAQLATDVMKQLNVPVYVYPDDIDNHGSCIDEKALLTQLSTAKVNLERLPPPPTRIEHTNVSHVVEDFNQSSVVSAEVDVEQGEIIPDPHAVEQFNVEEAVANFNQSSQFNEEIIQEGLAADEAADGISHLIEEPEGPVIDRSKVVLGEQEVPVVDRSKVGEIDLTGLKEDVSTSTDSSDEEDVGAQSRNVVPEFVPKQVEGDNSQYAGRKFGLIMNLNDSDYNHGEKMNLNENQLLFGEERSFALTMHKDQNPFINPAGLLLDIAEPNIQNDPNQQFVFGQHEWNTVIDSVPRQGMVWDVCDEFNTNPPAGTPFYLFPFHGRHNQHFVYKDEMIYAQQNGMVVTYVGGDEPLVMMPPSPILKARQTFKIQLL